MWHTWPCNINYLKLTTTYLIVPGAPINFRLPEVAIEAVECDSASAPISSPVEASSTSTSQHGPLNNETISQLLQELQEGSQSPGCSATVQEADSTHDFYS